MLPSAVGPSHDQISIMYADISVLEVAFPIEIRNESGLVRPPAQAFMGSFTRRRIVERGEMEEPTKMICGLYRGLDDDRQAQSRPIASQ